MSLNSLQCKYRQAVHLEFLTTNHMFSNEMKTVAGNMTNLYAKQYYKLPIIHLFIKLIQKSKIMGNQHLCYDVYM